MTPAQVEATPRTAHALKVIAPDWTPAQKMEYLTACMGTLERELRALSARLEEADDKIESLRIIANVNGDWNLKYAGMGEPSDLELTKACAEAMGLHLLPAYAENDIRYRPGGEWNGLMAHIGERPCLFIESGAYSPLHNDAQAMALVKKFSLLVQPDDAPAGKWRVHGYIRDDEWVQGSDKDLNRAICECVAKLPETERR